jgi:hypothetical protein
VTIKKLLAHSSLAAIMSLALAGCTYDTASAGWGEPYATSSVYDEPFYDGFDGPDVFVDGFRHFHRHDLDHHPFHHELHAGGFGHFHSGGIHMAHAGGFGGHGRA